MPPRLSRLRRVAAVAALGVPVAGVAQSLPSTRAALPALAERYCAQCHSGDEAERGFDIEALFSGMTAPAERVVLALQRIRSRTMPPADAEQPEAADRTALAAAVAALQPVDPGARVATVRRLSRAEYELSVRDLTGVAWSAKDSLPDDARAYGFDNVGDVQSVTPLLFEKYLDAATTISKQMLADPVARERLFAADRPLAATLPAFLERAFRRPPAPEEVAERLALHDALARSTGVAAAREALVRSVLASPAFLFRAELGDGDAGAPERLAPHELAVRLSYLVASRPPDDRLLALARDRSLLDAAILLAETRRLVAEDGGRALADGFAAQWLRFRDVLGAAADFRAYPQIWNGKLRPALYEEARHFFADLVRTDASVLELLDSDHTFLDKTLAKHYGFGAVKGDAFERVAVPDRRRGGVLGMGAVLMVTSYPLRTSPVLRGRWILDQLLDASTPPPPANAGTLSPDKGKAGEPSLRERLERHRRDRACASCHAQLDPLGFALEGFDVLGVWRDAVHGKPIDMKAQLPDGTELDGPEALKDALLARKDDFTRAMAKKLLVYAIGRPLVPDDEPELARVVASAARGEYRFSALLEAVVTSPLFLLRDPGGRR